MRYRVFAIALLACSPAQADLTVRYKSSVKTSKSLPAAVTDTVTKQLGVTLTGTRELRIKGDRLYSTLSGMTVIMDRTRKQTTLLHVATKRYATFNSDEYGAQLANLVPPAARQIMDGMQFDVNTQKTGKSAQIAEMRCDEFLVTVNMQMPNPGSAGLGMRMEAHQWVAGKEAMAASSALKQWDPNMWAATSGLDGFQGLGAMSQKLIGAMQDARKQMPGLPLKTETSIFVPLLAQMMQSQGAVASPDDPLITMLLDVDHIDDDLIDDAVFTVPQGFQEVPLSDLMQSMIPKPTDIH